MADDVLILGTVIGGAIVPTAAGDTYATHDSSLGKGGLMSLADEAARLAITTQRLRTGMIVYQIDTDTYYKLKAGYSTPTIAGDWEEISVPGITTTAFYVDGGTGNDSNPGTAASPFATIQKGLNEACLVSSRANTSIKVYAADGTYAETITVPQGASGYVKLIGNTTTPANCIIDNNSLFSYAFNHTFNKLILDIDGFEIQQCLAAYHVQDASLVIRYCRHTQANRMVVGDHAWIYLPVESDGTTSSEAVALSGSGAITLTNGSAFYSQQSLNLTNYDYDIHATNSFVSLASGHTITASSQDKIYSIYSIGSKIECNASLVSDAIAAGATNTGILADYGSTVYFPTGTAAHTLSNFAYPIRILNGSHVYAVDQTWNYVAVTNGVLIDNTSTYSSADNFDTTISYTNSAKQFGGAEWRQFNQSLIDSL